MYLWVDNQNLNRNLYKTDGLMIIGGVQEPNKQNLMHLLFYKTENFKTGSKGETASYELKVEAYPDTT